MSNLPTVLIDFDHTLFNTQAFIAKFPEAKNLKLNETIGSLDEFLYPDSLSFIHSLKNHFTPILFSEGPDPFQAQKIAKTSLISLIPEPHRFIYPINSKQQHLPLLIKKFQPLCLIDDHPAHLDSATKHGLFTLRLSRGKHAKESSQYPPTFICPDLEFISTNQILPRLQHPLKQARELHLVGIKGVGMTATALCLQDQGKVITGSDTLEPQITDQILTKRHIPVTTFDQVSLTQTQLVVFSGAYSLDNQVLAKARKKHLLCLPQAQVLSHLIRDKKSICVSGVGGKTTTTSMLSWIFHVLDKKPSWFVGTSQINQTLPPGKFDTGPDFIVEADEYAINPPVDTRPKFSLFNPKIIICTNLLFDHPDIYSNPQETLDTFISFFRRLPNGGHLIINAQTPALNHIRQELPGVNIHSFGPASSTADWKYHYNPSDQAITLTSPNQSITFTLGMFGAHNVANATAALIAAHLSGLSLESAAKSLKSFRGLKRRLELVQSKEEIDYFDDYAHHPHEIKAAILSLKQQFPERRLIVVFQAHTFSRTQALINDFSKAFTGADELIVLPIFASAREVSGSITGQDLAKAISKNHQATHFMESFPQTISWLKSFRRSGDVIVTLGAGDLYHLHQNL